LKWWGFIYFIIMRIFEFYFDGKNTKSISRVCFIFL
jgi:hypothetical protein